MKDGTPDPAEGAWIDYEIAETYFKMRRFEEALEYYARAIASDINDPWAHYKKGVVHLARGDASRGRGEIGFAIAESEAALAEGNQNPMILFNLGLFHLAVGDEARGGSYYTDALSRRASVYKLREAIGDLTELLEVRDVGEAGRRTLTLLEGQDGERCRPPATAEESDESTG